ncbi:MAG: response regulator [Desulfobulbaceae bacterium]|nr:response regulator [Desulfobulbaceae bacterium]
MESMNILVIDDEPIICSGCSLILSDLGHKVQTCMTCGEGIENIKKTNYDLILLDLKLPDKDGLELLKTVDNDNFGKIIVMTGYATIQSAINSMKLGAVDFLQKPFTEEELLETVNKVVELGS